MDRNNDDDFLVGTKHQEICQGERNVPLEVVLQETEKFYREVCGEAGLEAFREAQVRASELYGSNTGRLCERLLEEALEASKETRDAITHRVSALFSDELKQKQALPSFADLEPKINQAIADLLPYDPELRGCIIYGSWLRPGDPRPDSDLDLVVLKSSEEAPLHRSLREKIGKACNVVPEKDLRGELEVGLDDEMSIKYYIQVAVDGGGTFKVLSPFPDVHEKIKDLAEKVKQELNEEKI